MSPEQARGLPVDEQTDIWAIGCVLYEMLAGRAAFGRATMSDTIAAILEGEPDWNALPAAAPASVRRLVRRALTKDQKHRLHDVADARIELEEAMATATGSSGTAVPGILASARVVPSRVSRAGGVGAGRRRSLAGGVVGPLPARGVRGAEAGRTRSVSGERFDLPVRDRRALADPVSRRTSVGVCCGHVGRAGNSSGFVPSFQPPRSRFKGPMARRGLSGHPTAVRLGISATANCGDSTFLADLPSDHGSAVPRRDGGLVGARRRHRLRSRRRLESCVGGRRSGDHPHRSIRGAPGSPAFLPDGQHFLFVREQSREEETEICVGSLDSSDARCVLTVHSAARYAPPGYLLFVRDGVLRAQRFDPDRLELSGEAVQVAGSLIQSEPVWRPPPYSASNDGVLAVPSQLRRDAARLDEPRGQIAGRHRTDWWLRRARTVRRRHARCDSAQGYPDREHRSLALRSGSRHLVAVHLRAGTEQRRGVLS